MAGDWSVPAVLMISLIYTETSHYDWTPDYDLLQSVSASNHNRLLMVLDTTVYSTKRHASNSGTLYRGGRRTVCI